MNIAYEFIYITVQFQYIMTETHVETHVAVSGKKIENVKFCQECIN